MNEMPATKMPTATFRFAVGATQSSFMKRTFTHYVPASWSQMPERVTRAIPPLTDKSQAYFWSRAWQEGERAAEADIAAGRVRRFANAQAAARYLLSDED
jgi:hypothetical protein